MVQPASHGARAERTRAAVLEAAEALFAEGGFDATRLEDIAERVGIRRASIVYYFKDKRALYEAVLDSVFGGLHDALADVLARHEALTDQIEAGVSAWVDYVGTRPSIARLILREVANTTPERGGAILGQTRRLRALVQEQILDRPKRKQTRLAPIDPAHVASMVAGATVFFVAAMPTLVPDLGFDPLSREQLDAHKREVLRIVRRLLGTRGPHAKPRGRS
jgi:TetR/AcrR family transcriptional regulator